MIKVYTTGCPACRILEAKLASKGIEFETETDITVMEKLGIEMVPILELEKGNLLPYGDAIKWVNEYTGEN